jgi:DNA-binding SARP family transcriptional activator
MVIGGSPGRAERTPAMSGSSFTGHLLGIVSFTCAGRPVQRARLVAAIAGDMAKGLARRRVNTAVWRLRRLLDPDGVASESVLTPVGDSLTVSPACTVWTVWVDAVEFESACATLSRFDSWTETDARRIVAAVTLYRGDFLGGVYADWALTERGRLADLHLMALVRLAQWFRRRREPEEALVHARAAVALDPLREDLHRLVIQLYGDAGLPQLAARQLEHCRAVLAEQLGIDPLPETVTVARVATGPGRPQQDDYDRAVRELERSYEELRRLEARLGRSIQALRRGSVTGGDRGSGQVTPVTAGHAANGAFGPASHALKGPFGTLSVSNGPFRALTVARPDRWW